MSLLHESATGQAVREALRSRGIRLHDTAITAIVAAALIPPDEMIERVEAILRDPIAQLVDEAVVARRIVTAIYGSEATS